SSNLYYKLHYVANVLYLHYTHPNYLLNLRQRNPRVENIRRTKTDNNVFERKQAAHHQAGTNQQHNRKRDLRNNNARPPSAMNRVASAALSAIGKRSLHVPVYAMKSASQPADQGGKSGNRQPEPKLRRVMPNGGP